MSAYRVTEAYVRYSLIEPQLRYAVCMQVMTEIPVAGYDATPAPELTDYGLYHTNDEAQ